MLDGEQPWPIIGGIKYTVDLVSKDKILFVARKLGKSAVAFPLSFSSGPDQAMTLVALENIAPMRKTC